MDRRRPRLVVIQGGENTMIGPVTRLGLRRPGPSNWVLWGAIATKVLLLIAVLVAIHAFRR